ncbi:unnamed protein product [Trifolium pratense]|uniref:Uncharacterized protein n=1 Tax=Trifolium pratense TaxID=57577 RepID=A0ACB0J5I6_TRIPR|nr:unnamed protein product [Trifolium pratense]
MCEIVKFVVMIVFLSAFFISANIDSVYRCNRDVECRNKYCRRPREPRCIRHICTCVEVEDVGLDYVSTYFNI